MKISLSAARRRLFMAVSASVVASALCLSCSGESSQNGSGQYEQGQRQEKSIDLTPYVGEWWNPNMIGNRMIGGFALKIRPNGSAVLEYQNLQNGVRLITTDQYTDTYLQGNKLYVNIDGEWDYFLLNNGRVTSSTGHAFTKQ